jgi:prenyltransferase beta subunit
VSQKSSSEILDSAMPPPLVLSTADGNSWMRSQPPPFPPKIAGEAPQSTFGSGGLNQFNLPITPGKPLPPSPSVSQRGDLGQPETDEESPEATHSIYERLLPVTLKETPSWLISLVVHVAIILLLALIPLSDQIRSSISLLAGISDEQGQDELSVFDTQSDSAEADPNESLAMNLEPTLNELAVVDVTPSINSLTDLAVPLTITNGLRGRTGAMKDALLKAYGGTQGTEDAVAAGLKWLANNQRKDGSWSLVGPYTDGGVNENKPAASAMALLAFMGAGHTHQSGEYKEVVRKGITFVVKLQNKEGFFADQSAGNQRTYAHAQCSIAVCELYGMTGDKELRDAAQKSIRYAEKSQGKNGGWRYQPREAGDTSVTGWYVMALISARMAGLDVDSEVLERVHQFLDSVQRRAGSNRPDAEGERYAYMSYSAPTAAMTAEGMLCRLYLGWDTKDPRIVEGAEFLVGNPIAMEKDRVSYYYWYYATTTLHHIGGQAWTAWNQSMKEVLPKMQIASGRERGSWPTEEDNHANAGGRLYATCFALYCLESYYRHLPLSEMAPK